MPAGRPSKFNPERADKIIAAITDLIPYSLAAESNGITRTTLYDWINTGLADIQADKASDLAKFACTLKKQECVAIKELLADIKAGAKGWHSRAWILERRFPLEFAIGSQELMQLKQELENIKKLIQDNG